MLTLRSLFFFIALLLLFDGCRNDDLMRTPNASYFPLQVGYYQIYQVSETDINRIDCSTALSATNYQLKVLIFDSVKNSLGSYNYLIHRYTRPDSTQTWTILDSWSAYENANQVIVTESNVPFVKLVFPLVNNEQWNGNAYNDNGEEDYAMNHVGQPYTLNNGKKFSNTVNVVQSDNQDFIVYQDKRIEVYAASVGLIYKETTQLTYFQNSCGSSNTCCLGTQDPKSGIIYTQQLLSYGHE